MSKVFRSGLLWWVLFSGVKYVRCKEGLKKKMEENLEPAQQSGDGKT